MTRPAPTAADKPADLQKIAELHAPVVVLDCNEELWPMSAQDFIGSCVLGWVDNPGNVAERVDSVDAGRLGSAAATHAYATASSISANWHTRPFDAKNRRPTSLPLTKGWALQLRDSDNAVGTSSRSTDESVYEGVPVYYEWAVQCGTPYLTYWFCYAGSALPWAVVRILQRLRLAEEEVELVPGEPEEIRDALDTLALSHPDLYLAATTAAPEFTEVESGGVVAKLDPLTAAWHALASWIFEKAPAMWAAKGNPHFLCHQGDWESLTLELDPEDLHRAPRALVLFQHGEPSPLDWAQVEHASDTRPRVYSARGSHATLSHRADWPTRNGDRCTPGREWHTWESVNGVRDVDDAHEVSWYGFGGAWGAVGENSDLTGPLGPCVDKSPF